ncbi:MAG: hypothetical protein O7G30_08800, partial [Proteobacteria bacterium]|nr:hypothetical protein [Pseudomonadota bacterium]
EGVAARGRSAKRAYWTDGVGDELALHGATYGLPEGWAAGIPRAEMILADAEGFGPPLAVGGDPLPGYVARESPESAEEWLAVARGLFRAAHPGAIRAAAYAFRAGAPEASSALMARHCSHALDVECRPWLAAEPAGFEAWWVESAEYVRPSAPGVMALRER